ncbi:hypothetical protein H0Z60_15955 [Ectothiorhodospiraceae bacterium WFHF3C12]|nr:hypothetical protein [Ectothiorhodospiraceae bacterium WFHF3C12]
MSAEAAAFDGDTTLDDVNLKPENWLDIQAYSFRKSLDQQWNDGHDGFRFTGGSLNIDYLFVRTELRYRQALSEQLDMRLGWEEERFYAAEDYEHPYAELAYHPDALPLEFSFLGRSGYAKSGADFGGAVSLGRRPWNYVRLVGYAEESLYNDKNDADGSYYEREPNTIRLEGAYQLFGERLVTRFQLERNTPLEFVEEDGASTFRHDGSRYRAFLDYVPGDGHLYGITYRGFREEKSIAEPGSRRSQSLRYDGMGLYWQYTGRPDYELNLGVRVDRLENTLRERADGASGKDYRITTPQVYGVLTRWYAPRQGWELGTYLGRTWESTELRPSGETFDETTNQGKLRTSWMYRSLDGRSNLMLHFTFNLDDLARDPGDGAGMTYQGVF